MFTGIVEELGRFVGREGTRYRFEAKTVLDDAQLGDSIAVNGCCLTVVELAEDSWVADISLETATRTNLVDLTDGDPVNFERPVRMQDRLGGHVVLGHVDGVGSVVRPAPDLRVWMPAELGRYCVEKGSMTVDGVSLTIFDVSDDEFSVAIIPHTAEVTTLGHRKEGDRVNLEADILAKHVEKLLATGATESSDTGG